MSVLGQGRSKWIRIRIIVLSAAMSAGAVAVAHGAWELGVVRGEELTEMAREQYTRRLTLSAQRGMILDRHGEELAVEVEVESVYADPRRVEDPVRGGRLLAPLLEVPESRLVEKLSSDRHFVWLRRRVGPGVAEKVKELDVAGVDLIEESKRFYPGRTLASHVIGFAGVDSRGLEGIERRFDDLLRGKRDAAIGLSDAAGRVVFADGLFGAEGVVGSNVELTIDRTIQYIAEQELANTVRTFEAKAGHVIVMDPRNGEILAMVNNPSYNPNAIDKSTARSRRNRAVLDVFEPGSTFKVFTLAAALNSGAIRPDDMIYCERGRLEMYDAVIHDDHRDGWLNPTQCLKRSSNICFAKIALETGKRRLYHYLRRMGFGERAHLKVPYEMPGTLLHYKKWRDFDAATIAFGQGIGVTGIQLATALSAVANGGTLMRPRLVRRVVGSDGKVIRKFGPEPRRRVVSRYAARMVGDMMTAVTEEGGTGTQATLDGYLVAGKTGTAQKSTGSAGYEEGKWIASFLGFVPADRPRLVITVVIDEPLINHYGGTVAAPTMRRIADQALRYLGISPRLESESKRRKRRERAKNEEARPPPAAAREEDVFRETQDLGEGQVPTPDVSGRSMTAALESLSDAGLRAVFFGTGIAVEQVPPPGSPIDEGEFVQVNFRPLVEAGEREGSDDDRR